MADGPAYPSLSAVVSNLTASTPFVGPEALERQRGAAIRLRLGANESLFGPSPAVLTAISAAAAEVQLYGDPECHDLREVLARRHGLTREHIIVGPGIDALLGSFVRAFADPGDIAVMSLGGYPTFAYQALGHGLTIRNVPYRAYRNDPLALAAMARAVDAKLLYVSNPDNPTGSHLEPAEQWALLDGLPANCLLLLDEAYAEFAPAGSIPDLPANDPRVVCFRTFSKAQGLAGLRVGYAFGSPRTIRPIDRIRNQFGVGRLVQSAAIAALGDPDHVNGVVQATADGRRDYGKLAAELGFEALPSATNFVAIDTGSADRARTLVSRLLQDEGVFIRMPGVTPLDRCIRVTVGKSVDRVAFGDAIRRVIDAVP